MKLQSVSLVLLALCQCLIAVPVVAQDCMVGQQCILYENGKFNGEVYAWIINYGFAVTDSFYDDSEFLFDGISFWVWLYPGDYIESVEVSIGSTPYGTDLFHGFVTPYVPPQNCFTNRYDFSVCLETAQFNGPFIGGTAWLTLQNASVPNGDPVYWDQNGGVGCNSQGCPSLARQNGPGPTASIPSEAFAILGTGFTASAGKTH